MDVSLRQSRRERLNDTPNPGPAAAAMIDLRSTLADPRRYRRPIERLFDRTLLSPARHALRQDGVSLGALFDNQRRVSRLLARAVASGRYEFAPGRVRRILVEGKARDVYAFRLTDLLIHAAVAEIVEEAARPLFSSSLFSYRPGLSWVDAVSLFGSYIRRFRGAEPDPRRRGLYVIRRDIDAYTDSIPVDAASPLWPMLWRLFDPDGMPPPVPARTVVEEVVRPLVAAQSGGAFRLIRGVPTGQPISCVLFNLYLHELDRTLGSFPGAFYARYSDDILFAHRDPLTTAEAAAEIERAAGRLGLLLKKEKSQDLFLTAAGRGPGPDRPAERGTAFIPFLGVDVAADGTIALGREKTRALLRDLADRTSRTARILRGQPADRIGKAVCGVINRALKPGPGPFRQRSADILHDIVTFRPQLRHLDHLIARIVLHAVTGKDSPRAFRQVPYKTIRRDWGLVSLLHGRNRARERRS